MTIEDVLERMIKAAETARNEWLDGGVAASPAWRQRRMTRSLRSSRRCSGRHRPLRLPLSSDIQPLKPMPNTAELDELVQRR